MEKGDPSLAIIVLVCTWRRDIDVLFKRYYYAMQNSSVLNTDRIDVLVD